METVIQEAADRLCFRCGDDGGGGDGELKSARLKGLESLLTGDDPGPETFTDSTCELFGFRFTTASALREHMDRLFMLARQLIAEMQRPQMCSFGQVFQNDMSHLENRKKVKKFLEYIKIYLIRFSSRDVKFLETLVRCVHALLLHIGRVRDVPGYVIENATRVNSSAHHAFHLFLDVYWSTLEIAYVVTTKYPDIHIRTMLSTNRLEEDRLDSSFFTQLLEVCFWDLVLLPVNTFNKIVFSEYLETAPFHCSCVKEFWVFVIHLLSCKCREQGGASFWFTFHQVVQGIQQNGESYKEEKELDSNIIVNPPVFSLENPTGFSLWMISHLSCLHCYDIQGHLINMDQAESNFLDVLDLIKKRLSQGEVAEAELRCYLKCCLKVSRLWEPDVRLLVILWDYFCRKLNETFYSGVGVKELQVIRSVSGLLEQCKQWCCGSVCSIDEHNSFFLFLHLVSLHLSKLIRNNHISEWKQMKGRFFSKFHQRRMQELTESGLYNFTCLFLTLALTADLEDVAGKLCNFYDMANFSSINSNRRAVIWKGMFALMQIYVEHKLDIGFLADKILTSFETVCSEFCHVGLEYGKRHGLWQLLNIYIDGLQELIEASKLLDLSEHRLISKSFQSILPHCRDGELRNIWSMIQLLMMKLRYILSLVDSGQYSISHSNLRYQDLCSTLWSNIFPFIKGYAETPTCPDDLADVAAGFCLLSLDIPKGRNCPGFQTVFLHFAAADTVNPGVSCRFLGHVLASDVVMEQLTKESFSVDYQVVLIRCWIRCSLFVSENSAQLLSLSQQMRKFPQVSDVFHFVEMDVEENGIIDFFVALGKAYYKTEGLKDKTELRKKVCPYFDDIVRYVQAVVKSDHEMLKTVYIVLGHLVKNCAPLLFVQSSQECPLPAIIDHLVVPHFIFYSGKPVSSSFLSSVRDTLHLFVAGLSKLDYRRAPYIERRLRDIIVVYVPRFPMKTPSGSNAAFVLHPLLMSFNNSYGKQATTEDIAFRQFFLSLIHQNLLKPCNMKLPATAAVGFSFITEIIQRTHSSAQLARDSLTLLSVTLECHLIFDSSSLKQHAVHMLQCLMKACQKHPDQAPRAKLATAMWAFVRSYFKMFPDGVISTLGKLISVHLDLLLDTLPVLTEQLKMIEVKRGVGADTKLRQTYVTLLKSLGEAGEEEMQRLQNSDVDIAPDI